MPGIQDYARINPLDDEVIVQQDALSDLCRKVYTAVGVPDDDAALVAGLQAETDVRGIHSHGTRTMPGYLVRLEVML